MWHGGGWFAYMRAGDQKPKVTRALLTRVLAYARPYRWEIVGMLAAIMSTLNSQAFVSSMTVGRDIVARLRGRMEEYATTGPVRWGIVLTAFLSIALALAVPSVIRLWYTIGTVVIPGLLLPLVASYFDRVRPGPGTALASMAAGWLVSLLWLLAGWSKEMGSSAYYPLGVEPMYAGLTASAASPSAVPPTWS